MFSHKWELCLRPNQTMHLVLFVAADDDDDNNEEHDDMLMMMTMMNTTMLLMMMRLAGVLSFCRGGYLPCPPPPPSLPIHDQTLGHHFCNDDYDPHNDHENH